MDGHLSAWRINRALAWIYALAMLGLAAFQHYRPGLLPPRAVFMAFGTLPVLLVFHALAARGALLRQPWARIASLAMACLLLLAIPVGTILGAMLIWACSHPWPDPRVHASAPRGGWHQDGRRR
jgi:hypothetical protein